MGLFTFFRKNILTKKREHSKKYYIPVQQPKQPQKTYMKMFSKFFGSSAAVATALALGASNLQAAPAIVNPGFESATGFTANPIGLSGENQGWATFGSSRSDMSASVDFPQSGTNSLLAVNGVGNNWN